MISKHLHTIRPPIALAGLVFLVSALVLDPASAQDAATGGAAPPGAATPAPAAGGQPPAPPSPAPAATVGPGADTAPRVTVGAQTAPAAAQAQAQSGRAPAPAETAAPGSGAAPTAAAPGSPAAPAVAANAGRDAALPHDLSPWGMFTAADWVVKSVMIGLAFASLVTWTIWLAKALELTVARRRARNGVRRLAEAGTLGAAIAETGRRRPRGPVAALALAAEEERARSADLGSDGIKERAAVALSRIEARAGRDMARGTGLLATIGSTAPFVGLFGTVWGIMNAFIGISEANTTNLAVVAPGIAEALLATAVGLVAAIPAVIIYNAFARSIAGYRAVLSDGSALVLQHLSRELDRRQAGAGRTAHLAQAAE